MGEPEIKRSCGTAFLRDRFYLRSAPNYQRMNTHSQIMCLHDGDPFEVTNVSSGNTHPAEWFLRWVSGGHTSDSGMCVNGYTALTLCPLWQGVNIIAGDIGQVPIRVVRNKFEDQTKHNAWNLLRVRPNELQTASVWKETMMQWALIWGNGVSWTPRAGSRITDMIPLRPDCLWPELVAFDDGQELIYHYYSPTTGRQFEFFPDDVIHIQGLTGDGIWGYPLYEIAQNCIGQGLALEKHGNKQFSNGARPSGVLKHAGKMGPEARANLRAEWNAIHEGPDNSGKVAILWEGMDFQAMQMSNVDSQWIEAKKLSRVDAASLLNLPAHKLNELSDSSVRANLEEQNETYKQMTLTRWANRLDEEFRRKLLTFKEWQSDEFRFIFDWDAFLTADIDTLTSVGDRCVKAEIMNRNEAREMIGLAPYDGGERFGNPATSPSNGDIPDPKSISDILQSIYLAVVNGVISPNEARQIARMAGADLPDLGNEGDEIEFSSSGGSSAESGSSPAVPQNRISNLVNAHQELLFNQIVAFIERESHTVLRQSGMAENFVRWIDRFYLGLDGDIADINALADSILGASIRACLSAGLDARGVHSAISNYAKIRHKQCLEACSGVNRAQLPAAIERLNGSDITLVARGLLATALSLQHEMNGAA